MVLEASVENRRGLKAEPLTKIVPGFNNVGGEGMKLIGAISPAVVLFALGSVACGHHHHHDEAVYAEPAPVGYVYEPGYYDRGYYRDNAVDGQSQALRRGIIR